MIELRDYQKSQVNFLKSNIGTCGSLFKQNISLQSPTGSGKSITMLYFLKEYLSSNKESNVFISTGFSELVFQIAEDAKNMGINTEILMGSSNLSCLKRMVSNGYDEDDYYAYDKDIPYYLKADALECRSCEYLRNDMCLQQEVLKRISDGGVLVITNHSTYLHHSDWFEDFDGGFIDECQAFPDFYSSYKSVDIPAKDILNIIKVAESDTKETKNSIELAVFKSSVDSGTLKPKALRNLLKMRVTQRNVFGGGVHSFLIGDKFPVVKKSCDVWNEIGDSERPDIFVHQQYEGGMFCGVKVDVFFDRIYIPNNVCITSATVDPYTKSVIGVKESYNETNCNLTDYSKSSVNIYEKFDFESIYDFVSKQTADHGLILSTRLDIVNELINKKFVFGYEIITKSSQFNDGKRQILVGSKSLFQGVNIPSIGFVLINKIPFPRYNDSFRKMMNYLDNLGHSSYRFYTIPYTTNQLIQSMGRLWRKPGDFGNIAIFDRSACLKHKDILLSALSYRKGIAVNW